jgi:hypothetical protein
MTAEFVVVLVLGILALQALVWIPIIVWFRRRNRVVAARLAAEIESENVVRPPERASYQGATAPGYPSVRNSGRIALTRRRLLFYTLTGKIIEVPLDAISGVRQAKTFNRSARGGYTFLVIQVPAGELGFYVADVAAWIASLTAIVPRLAAW